MRGQQHCRGWAANAYASLATASRSRFCWPPLPLLLLAARDIMLGTRTPASLWKWLASLEDANGRAHGVHAGSLATRQERAAASLRPTAAALRR